MLQWGVARLRPTVMQGKILCRHISPLTLESHGASVMRGQGGKHVRGPAPPQGADPQWVCLLPRTRHRASVRLLPFPSSA